MPAAAANLADAVVATPPSPATSGTGLTVATGYGARFSAAPFSIVITQANARPSRENSEIALVTAKVGDVFTITRAQGGTSARTIVAGDTVSQIITAADWTAVEASIAAAQADVADLEAAVAAVVPFTLTTVEVALTTGAARISGTFDITGLSGLTAGKPVAITQAAAAYTGKGTLLDESEMDMVIATAYVLNATTIRAFWQSCVSPVLGNFKFNYAISA